MYSPGCLLLLLALSTPYTTAFDPLGMFRSQIRSLYTVKDDTLTGQQQDNNDLSGDNNILSGKSASDTSWFSFSQAETEMGTESQLMAKSTESPSTTEVNVIYYSTKRTTNSVLESLFDIGVADIKASDNADDVLNDSNNNINSDRPNIRTNNHYREDYNPNKNQLEEDHHTKNEIPDDFKPPTNIAGINELMQSLKGLNFLPLVKMAEGEHGINHIDGTPDSLLMKYLDTIRDDAWGQFKSLALSYTNWLEDEYKLQDLPDQLPLELIKKVLNLGDRVNFLHVVGKRIDPGMASFLADQLQPLFNRIQQLGPSGLTGTTVSSTVGNIVNDAAMKALRQFTDHVIHVAGRFVSQPELDKFQQDLSKTSPLAAKGLDILLHGPPNEGRALGADVPSSRQGRQRNWQRGYGDYDYGSSSSGGYGGYGAYDESYGGGGGHQSSGYDTSSYGGGMSYQHGVYLDPYLILGGIGAAALLAFLAYRLIVTTARRKRSLDDLTFMDLSDVPSFVHSIYNMLETAEEKYLSPISNSIEGITADNTMDASDELAQGINALWWAKANTMDSHDEKDTNVTVEYSNNSNSNSNIVNNSGCIRCSLFDLVNRRAYMGHESANNIVLAGIAHLLGSEKAGQLIDEVTGRSLDGEQLACIRTGQTCAVK